MKDALQVFFVSYDGGGIKYADTIGLSILFCLQQKKKYIKKLKKKQKINWNTAARNRTLAVCVRVRYRSLTPLQKF